MPSAAPTPRALVWMHATDTGSVTALRQLARQIAETRNGPQTLMTGHGVGADPGASAADLTGFLDRHGPALLVLCGGELPATLIDAARRRGLPILLVQARRPLLTGFRRLWPGHLRGLLGAMAEIHAIDPASATALRALAPAHVKVEATGPLAHIPPAPRCNPFELEAMRKALANRPVWFACALPAAEVEPALLAHVQALRRAHRLLLIASPAHAEQGEAMAERARDVGFSCARRALDQDITETTQVYIADAEDEPGLFLRLASITYLGGSLTRHADTPSPLLPTSLGSALVFGPHAAAGDRPFLDRLDDARAARRIATPPDLGDAISALLAPEIGAEAAVRAWGITTEGSEATHLLAARICDRVRAAMDPPA